MKLAPSAFLPVSVAVLALLLVSGCKRPVSDEAEGESAATNALAFSRGQDLGVVLLTNRVETRIDVGESNSCVIKPFQMDKQNVRLIMTLESRMPDGKTRGLKVITVVAKPDQPFEVDFGSLTFVLTPQMAAPASAP